MQLTGLEVLLCTAGAGIITGFLTHIIKDKLNQSSYVSNKEYSKQIEICTDRFDRGNGKMEHTIEEVNKLSKRFERFVVYSDLPSEIKAKILNGD